MSLKDDASIRYGRRYAGAQRQFDAVGPDRTDRLVEGSPEVLIRNGKVNYQKLWDVNVSKADLMAALRANQCISPHEAELAVLETNGQITVKKKQS